MNRKIFLLLGVFALLFAAGCKASVSVRKADASERFAYEYYKENLSLMPVSSNLLADHLLLETYRDDPRDLLFRLQDLYKNEPRKEYVSTMADAALNCAFRFAGKEDLAARYFLSSAYYAYRYLAELDKAVEAPYDADRIRILRIYNTAASELFAYLRKKGLYRKDSYSLATAVSQKITFRKATYSLPLPADAYKDFLLCASYRPKNLTHTTRHSGLGVPLICELNTPKNDSSMEHYAKDQMLPATLVIHFSTGKDSSIDAHLAFLDSRSQESTMLGKSRIPLEMDFSTPVAYMAKKPLPYGGIQYMLFPEKSSTMQGLYKFEPFHEKRIPVLLVHGLMSNTRTWMQMLNTLQNDPELRKYYQFWGFSYSSGNPILYSASLLRKALRAEREKLVKEGKSTAMFDRMVIVGHSMGGLLAKTTIMDSGTRLKEVLMTGIRKDVLDRVDPKEKAFLDSLWQFESLPFVKRVIFIAVPHRGSSFARAWIGRLGSRLVELPGQLVSSVSNVIKLVLPEKKEDIRSALPTGIDNLDPDSPVLRSLANIPFRKGVPYHSIIGNRRSGEIPGGTDGIVPYKSSHLDGAESELIVRSGHSAQQNPLAIQEVRRILLKHLAAFESPKK